MHSLVFEDYKTGERVSCTDNDGRYPSIETALDALAEADYITAHNAVAYDVPVLRKLFPRWSTKARVIDTLVISRSLFAHRKELDFAFVRKHPSFPKNLIGHHSLKAWGYRLGQHKTEFDGPWDQWSEEMQSYCEDDVAALKVLAQYLRRNKRYDVKHMEMEHTLQTFLDNGSRAGLPLDVPKAKKLWATLNADFAKLKQETAETFGCWFKPDNTKNKEWLKLRGKKSGKIRKYRVFRPKRDDPYILPKRSKRDHGKGYVAGAPCTQLRVIEFSATSRDHIAKVLLDRGWQPEEFTEKEQKPKVTEESLQGLKFEHIDDIQRILMLAKRLGTLGKGDKSWLELVDENGSLHPRIYSTGAITHRGKHADPNISQAPKVKNPYGTEFRELIYAPKGWGIVGTDVSGLELRALGHELYPYDDGQYIEWVLHGDVHEKHREMMGNLLDRDDMKTWFYAYLYGAGDQKLGRIIAPHKSPEEQKKIGRKFRRLFEQNLAALGELQKATKREAKTGWIRLIDGTPACVRSEHAALNTKLQGSGAQICKYWLADTNTELVKLYGKDVGDTVFNNIPPTQWIKHGVWTMPIWAHDEGQWFIHLDSVDVDVVKELTVKHIVRQQEKLGFRCELTGEAKYGRNWAETH